MPNLFARQTALTNVGGRIDYISNPERQENLLAVYDGAADRADGAYWRLLAQECKEASKHAAPDRKCVQGRELIIQLSNALLDRMTPAQIAKILAFSFEQKYGRPCVVAVHFNADRTNLHAHLIYSERDLLPEPVVKVAPRALFFDETGKRCYKKKEIQDEAGDLRPGCRIVAKGEIYERRFFSAVDPSFSQKGWLKDCKANWLLPLRNGDLKGDVTITMYNKDSGKLAQQHVGPVKHVDDPAAKEKAAQISEYNQAVKEFNGLVDAKAVIRTEVAAMQQSVQAAPKKNGVIQVVIVRFKELVKLFQARKEQQAQKERWAQIMARSKPVTPGPVRAAAPAPTEPARPEPVPVPSFAALIAADEEVEKRRSAVQVASLAVGEERKINQDLIDLPAQLRGAVARLREAKRTFDATEADLLKAKWPEAPKGIFVSKKRQAEYDSAMEQHRAKIEPKQKILAESRTAIQENLALLMGYLRPEERQKQGYGRNAPVITADNLTSSDIWNIERFIEFKLDRGRGIGMAAALEKRYADNLGALTAAKTALGGAEAAYQAKLREIPSEHREAALRAVEKARSERAEEAEAQALAEREQPGRSVAKSSLILE